MMIRIVGTEVVVESSARLRGERMDYRTCWSFIWGSGPKIGRIPKSLKVLEIDGNFFV